VLAFIPPVELFGIRRGRIQHDKFVLYVDGKEVARNSVEHTTPITFPEDETFDIGQDTRTGVALLEYRYDVPFKFTGKIDKLTFKLEPWPKAAAGR
jgi:arylsulfatase